jgi:hypothetical protein
MRRDFDLNCLSNAVFRKEIVSIIQTFLLQNGLEILYKQLINKVGIYF